MPILEGSKKGYSNDIPTEFRGRVGEEIPCDYHTERSTLKVGVKLEEFGEDEETESWPFRELVGGSMQLAIPTCPDITNAVRSVARYTVPHRKPSTGNRRLVFWHTSMVLVAFALHTSERLQ